MRKKLSEAQLLLGTHLEELGFTGVVYEARFDVARKWRADVRATGPVPHHDSEFLFEIEGVGRTHEGKFGRHQSIGGFIADMGKYNHATMLGYRVLRFTTAQVLRGQARKFIEENL